MSSKPSKQSYLIPLIVILSIALMIVVEVVGLPFFRNELSQRLAEDSVIRLFGGCVFIILMITFGYKHLYRFKKPTVYVLLLLIPAMVVSVNNLPISAMIQGRTALTESSTTVLLFAVDAFSTGFFEEIIFRGLIFIVLLQKLPHTKKGVFQAILYSSILFGGIHLLNLFAGAGLYNTVLQIGYSFLTGMMWATIFLLTKNLWYSILSHAVYNFCGMLFFTVGTVENRYDAVTIIITVLFALAAIVFYLHQYKKTDIENLSSLYTPLEV